MTSLTIDIAEVKTMSKQLNNGAKIVQSQLVIAGREAGMIFIGAAQSAAPVDIGNLRAGIGPPVISGSNGVIVKISTHSPYAVWVHDGRGAITASGKALAFVPKGSGEMIFRKSVGPQAANPFFDKALQASQDNILRAFEKAGDRIIKMVLGA